MVSLPLGYMESIGGEVGSMIKGGDMPEQNIYKDMCEWFNPLFGGRCEKKREGNLKCHSKNKGCPDYQPTEYIRKHLPTH